MELFSSRPAGDAMAVTIWGTASSWTLTALPLFVWMGEILFRTRLSEDMFSGLAPWLERVPGRLLHTNIIGCTIFAAVSGSSAATCATIGKMTLPELKTRGYPDDITIGTLAGAGTLGPPDPAVDHHDRLRRHGRTCRSRSSSSPASFPASCWRSLFSGYIVVWALLHPGADSRRRRAHDDRAEALRVAPPDSGRAADRRSCWARSTPASRPRPRPPRSASSARSLISAVQGSLDRDDVRRQPDGRDAPLLHDRADPRRRRVPDAGDGLHRAAARTSPSGSAALGLSPFALIVALMVVLHRPRLLPRRHLDGRADDGRDPADGREGRASTCSGSASSSCWSSRWRRSRRRSASTCSCCRA